MSSLHPIFQQIFTAHFGIMPMTDFVTEYLAALPWSDQATEHEKTLVEANIRTFANAAAARIAELHQEGGYGYDDAHYRHAYSEGVKAGAEVLAPHE